MAYSTSILCYRGISRYRTRAVAVSISGVNSLLLQKDGEIFLWGGCEAGTFPVRFNVQWGVPRPDARIKSPKLFEVYVSGAFGEGLKLLKMPQGCEILRATLCEPDGMEITLVVVFPYAVLPYFEAYLFKSFGEIAVGAG